MNAVEPLIKHAVDVELTAARQDHGEFNSLHEACAVIFEEFEEAGTELNCAKFALDRMWHDNARRDNTIGLNEMIDALESHAVNLAIEAVQMAAMARKASALAENEDCKTWFGKE